MQAVKSKDPTNNMKGRPDVCKLFAIDQRDIDDVAVSGGHCGYWFEEDE